VLPYLERLRAELSIPILYVSHALDEVARLADNLVLLQHGSVVAAGPLGDLLSRLDLPLAVGEQAGVVIEARVAVHDAQHALTRLDFGDSSLWVSALNQPIGARSRARVLARDVSLALSPPGPSSILNVLSARITELRDQGPDRVNVRLLVGSGEAPLLARVTRRSRDELGLRPGLTVYALVKSVSVTA
jgi:molybdate transport system ATP-binding protein